MNPFAPYEAINTKLHARNHMFLSKEEWKHVMAYKSVGEIATFLAQKEGYKRVAATLLSGKLHRTELENILDRYQVTEIQNMLYYYSGGYRAFFKVFLMEYEILDLELILRSIVTQERINTSYFLCDKVHYSNIDYVHQVEQVKNINDFIEGLKGTRYYDTLKSLAEDDLSKKEYHMEMKLYLLFYRELMEKACKLNKRDQEIVRYLIGTKIDFLNAQWIYRALKYYYISPEEILIYSLKDGRKLTYSKLKRLCYCKSIEEFKTKVQKDLGYSLFKEDDVLVDCYSRRYLYQMMRGLDKDEKSIAPSISYLYLLRIEVNDLITLIETIRYAVPYEARKKYLVHSL